MARTMAVMRATVRSDGSREPDPIVGTLKLQRMGSSRAKKDAPIATLFARQSEALERITALEAPVAELTRPPKTPGNSSNPYRKGRKLTAQSPAATVRRARAVLAWAGRCIRSRIVSSTRGLPPRRRSKRSCSPVRLSVPARHPCG